MSLGLRALILLRLDARLARVVPVQELADHLGLSADVVRQRIDELWREGYVQPQWDTAGDRTIITGAMVTRRLPPCA